MKKLVQVTLNASWFTEFSWSDWFQLILYLDLLYAYLLAPVPPGAAEGGRNLNLRPTSSCWSPEVKPDPPVLTEGTETNPSCDYHMG